MCTSCTNCIHKRQKSSLNWFDTWPLMSNTITFQTYLDLAGKDCLSRLREGLDKASLPLIEKKISSADNRVLMRSPGPFDL